MKRILLPLLLSACTSENVSFQTAEEARVTARDNAKIMAQSFRAANDLAEWSIYSRGDSTISQKCPTGDGWASIDLRNKGQVIKLKCSTVSVGIGCMTAKDFRSKSYANEDGSCNKDIPFPLPKVAL